MEEWASATGPCVATARAAEAAAQPATRARSPDIATRADRICGHPSVSTRFPRIAPVRSTFDIPSTTLCIMRVTLQRKD